MTEILGIHLYENNMAWPYFLGFDIIDGKRDKTSESTIIKRRLTTQLVIHSIMNPSYLEILRQSWHPYSGGACKIKLKNLYVK